MAARVLADMHVPPALRRWSIRVALAFVVAVVIAWIPAGGDDRATRLRAQLDELEAEATTLRARNRRLAAEVEALRTEPAAIEAHARDELGMVYPGELVLRLDPVVAAPAAGGGAR
ncbi:MAG: septum formation initiator family protein [Myxococcales bacterium]|nr:septum formation initiator family protein [Myxococcales bacterium]